MYGIHGADGDFRVGDVLRVSCGPRSIRGLGSGGMVVGIHEMLVRIIDIGRYDPPQDVGRLPRPHTMLVVVPADYSDEALSEDAGDTIDLDSAAPLAVELVFRS
ncbi:hypothetical protein ACFVQ0_16165 [Streptomyces sp. NPDC057900]|uniref:hypothetical protein n=1 Tax=Streptomyces sp. NPDC057900 TaxID=3346274 RepID=UPI0036E9FB74